MKQVCSLELETSTVIVEFSSFALKHILALFLKNSHTTSFPHEYGKPSAKKNFLNKWLALTTDMPIMLLELYTVVLWDLPLSVTKREDTWRKHSMSVLIYWAPGSLWHYLFVPSENNSWCYWFQFF